METTAYVTPSNRDPPTGHHPEPLAEASTLIKTGMWKSHKKRGLPKAMEELIEKMSSGAKCQ